MHRNSLEPEQKPNGAIHELLKGENWNTGAMGYVAKGIHKAVTTSMIMEPKLGLDSGLEGRRHNVL